MTRKLPPPSFADYFKDNIPNFGKHKLYLVHVIEGESIPCCFEKLMAANRESQIELEMETVRHEATLRHIKPTNWKEYQESLRATSDLLLKRANEIEPLVKDE